jgi:hypothetical protein
MHVAALTEEGQTTDWIFFSKQDDDVRRRKMDKRTTREKG